MDKNLRTLAVPLNFIKTERVGLAHVVIHSLMKRAGFTFDGKRRFQEVINPHEGTVLYMQWDK